MFVNKANVILSVRVGYRRTDTWSFEPKTCGTENQDSEKVDDLSLNYAHDLDLTHERDVGLYKRTFCPRMFSLGHFALGEGTINKMPYRKKAQP